MPQRATALNDDDQADCQLAWQTPSQNKTKLDLSAVCLTDRREAVNACDVEGDGTVFLLPTLDLDAFLEGILALDAGTTTQTTRT